MKESVLITVPILEFKNMLKEVVKEEIKNLVDQSKFEELIKSEEAAELLGVSRNTLLSWRKQGILPFHQINLLPAIKR